MNEDKELVEAVRKALRENGGFCPCVKNSKGQPKYQCICEDFRLNGKVGETCHCGLYIKDAID